MSKYPLLAVLACLVPSVLMADSQFHQCGEAAGQKSYKLQFKKPSMFGDVFVVDADSKRYLRFGDACGADQSAIDLLAPDKVIMEYVRHASLSLVYAQQHKSVLLVGMGGGVFSNLFAKQFTDIEVDAIEIDPVVVEAAKAYFDVKETSNYRIHIQDAAAFVSQTNKHYDIIMLDAYDGEGIPEHLATKKFFQRVTKLLNPGGVIVANFGLDSPQVYLRLAEHLRETVGATRCLHGRQEANLVVIAASDVLIDKSIKERAADLDKSLSLSYSLSDITKRVKDCPRI